MNNIIKRIIKQAVDYEIENDKKLYQNLQEMRKWGGTVAMKKYWEVFHYRADGYEQVLKTEFKLHANKVVKEKLFKAVVIMIVINFLILCLLSLIITELYYWLY